MPRCRVRRGFESRRRCMDKSNGKVRWDEMTERLATQQEIEDVFAASMATARARREDALRKRESRRQTFRLVLAVSALLGLALLAFYAAGGIAVLVEGW